MPSPVTAEVVNAVVGAVLELLRTCGAPDAQVGRPQLVQNLAGAPCVSVSVEVRGTVHGPIYWTFEPAVADELIRRLFPVLAPELPAASQVDALGELGNIILGNATGALHDAGYPVEILPPQVVTAEQGAGGTLPRRILEVPVRTPQGDIKVLLGVEVQHPAAPAA